MSCGAWAVTVMVSATVFALEEQAGQIGASPPVQHAAEQPQRRRVIVLEPSGEEVWYNHLTSKSGGRLCADVPSGFGPETYIAPHLGSGRYQIALRYYNGDTTRQTLTTLAHVIVYVRGERQDYFVALASAKEKQVVATVGR
jgi:uncharacterized protein YfaP (DUF2135 family)